MSTTDWPRFDRAPGGCLPAIAQDVENGEVLMMAYMNAESFRLTVDSGQAVYFSRSRNQLWRKGETSGHTQQVVAVYLDCDEDAILLKVKQVGAACHKGYRSCFYRELTPNGLRVIRPQMVDPSQVYGGDKQ